MKTDLEEVRYRITPTYLRSLADQAQAKARLVETKPGQLPLVEVYVDVQTLRDAADELDELRAANAARSSS